MQPSGQVRRAHPASRALGALEANDDVCRPAAPSIVVRPRVRARGSDTADLTAAACLESGDIRGMTTWSGAGPAGARPMRARPVP